MRHTLEPRERERERERERDLLGTISITGYTHEVASGMASQIVQARGGGKTHCSRGYTITTECTHTAEEAAAVALEQ